MQEAHAYLSKEQKNALFIINKFVTDRFGEGQFVVFPSDIFQKERDYYAGLLREAEFYKGTAEGESRAKDAIVVKGCLERLEILTEEQNHEIYKKAIGQVKKVRKDNAHS